MWAEGVIQSNENERKKGGRSIGEANIGVKEARQCILTTLGRLQC